MLCIIEVKVGDADGWLGRGGLLTAENFFPDFNIDDGYKVLLTRQKRSGVYRKNSKLILPVDTVKNYHLDRTFFSHKLLMASFFPKRSIVLMEKD